MERPARIEIPAPLLRSSLAAIDEAHVAHRFTDVLIIGSGVAGLSVARAASRDAGVRIMVIARGALDDTATRRAQGGVAAVVVPDVTGDSIEAHENDTIEAGRGLANPEVVRTVVTEGVERVREIAEIGVEFDRDESGRLTCGLEGGHSHPRVVHRSDTTGAEIQRGLLAHVGSHPNVTCLDQTFAIDLLVVDGRVRGAALYRAHGEIELVWARATVLATGGLGQIYRETTNPEVATGDGVALAYRAGATLADLEFVQFHPTVLYLAGAERFLITEALRGEGAVLRDGGGRRFMVGLDPRAELAPRDIVSRSITATLRERGENKVWLDLTALPADRVRARFPRVLEILQGFGIDALKEPIPVRPSVHYAVGGVLTDLRGCTDVPGLLAAGEVAATGLHGANRLASNSLLEGLVLGHRAGLQAVAEVATQPAPGPSPMSRQDAGEERRGRALDLDDLDTSIRSLLWRKVGLERHHRDLTDALTQIGEWLGQVSQCSDLDPPGWIIRNKLTAAYLVALSARRRRESRGVHFRSDFPEPDDDAFRRRLFLSRRELAREPIR